MNPRKQLILQLINESESKMEIPKTLVARSEQKLWMGDIRLLAEELEAEGYLRFIHGTNFMYYRLTMKGEAQAVLNGDVSKSFRFGNYSETRWPQPEDCKLRYVPEELRA